MRAIAIWVWFCAYLNCAGWGLSAIHELNAAGYAVTLLLGVAVWLAWQRKTSAQIFPELRWQKLGRRFRRAFPLAFLVLTAMIFLGGMLYPPENYDALAYRLSRVLHWLAAGQWHWIHTIFPRVNQRACGMEWVLAPLIALTKTDRLLFLINIASFLFLPGLVYSVFTQLGVRRRVAWHWMWIIPTGYCFLLQAGSAGNDLFGAPFALAAIDYALRARSSQCWRDFFTSVLAAALMTGAKTSNLPLLLPWAIALLPAWKILLRRPLGTVAVCVMAAFASFLPTAVLNLHFCDDWTGWRAEGTPQRNAPLLRVPANLALITVENLTPPVFPVAKRWNQAVQKIIPAGLSERMHETVVEPTAAEFHAQEMQVEETAGLGFGVTLLILGSIVFAVIKGRLGSSFCFSTPEAIWQTCVRWTPWISLVALLSQSEVYPIGRILAPYYALLISALLVCPAHEQLVKKSGWRMAAFAVFIIAGGLLVIQPPRPLFPVQTLLEKFPNAPERVCAVYSVYSKRHDAFAPALAQLPRDLKVLGLISYDDPETSLWQPFGSRRIIHVRPEDSASDLKARGVKYILAKDEVFGKWFPFTLDAWLKQVNAQVVQKIPLKLRASSDAEDWYLVQLR